MSEEIDQAIKEIGLTTCRPCGQILCMCGNTDNITRIIRHFFGRFTIAETELQSLREQIAKTEMNHCEHCGSYRIINDGCPRCGAPVCCQTCCQNDIIDDLLKTVRFKTKRGDFLVHISELDTLKVTCGNAVMAVQPNANNSIECYGNKYSAGRTK